MRVVFDSNTFSDEHFEWLKKSPMLRLCAVGRIIPIYSALFIQETFHTYGNASKRRALIDEWLPFILQTSDRICAPGAEIRHRELVQGHGPQTNIYLRPRYQHHLLQRLQEVPLDGTFDLWPQIKKQKTAAETNRLAGTKRYRKLRQIHQNEAKALGSWQQYLSRNLEKHGRQLLEISSAALIKKQQLDAFFLPLGGRSVSQLFDQWKRNKLYFPYFTQAVTNLTYFLYYAAACNERIDVNGGSDLEILAHLVGADAVVSNECKFFKSAYRTLWEPQGKRLFTSREFAEYLRKL